MRVPGPRTAGWAARAAGALAWVLVAGLAPGAALAQSVRVTTNMGSFVIELDAERAPLTVANFLRYVNEGFYTNTLFHRVVGNFVIQGGGHSATDYKLKPTHENVVNESGNGLQNKRGTVGMARSNAPHSGNAQFYINIADNPELDPLPTRWGYAVFGRVTEGMEVIDKIGVVATGAVGPFKSEAPLEPIVIQKIEVLKGNSTSSAAPGAAPTPPPPPPAAEGATSSGESAAPAGESPTPPPTGESAPTPPPAGESAPPPR
ncbi:MAG: peptidylprolyl isomerase [Steroidobacteraceae bacterium]|nr:peptidylprolyl isomerase [Steroidobacteraceae bacterium]